MLQSAPQEPFTLTVPHNGTFFFCSCFCHEPAIAKSEVIMQLAIESSIWLSVCRLVF